METLLLPPTKLVAAPYYCPSCLKSLSPSVAGACPVCHSSPSRLKRMVRCLLCKSRRTKVVLPNEQLIPELATSKSVSFETESQSSNGKTHCFQQCCALCGLLPQPAESDVDALPLPIPRSWQCVCGAPNTPDHHICVTCRRTNRALLFRHISAQVRRSLDAGLFVMTEAAFLLAGVCRECGDNTSFGTTLCRDCRGRA